MKNKLVFRILGALSSALIIASVFIPFVSVTGYSQSLWQAHSAVGTLYLPIMIIVFGGIGVLCFATNIKTELAYASSGALLFFLIMQTIPIIDGGTFNTLSVGYYCLCVGTILIGVMAFLCNLRFKNKVADTVSTEPQKEESMINQIDRLYNNEVVENNNLDNDMINNVIQPIQTIPNNTIEQIEVPQIQDLSVENQVPPTINSKVVADAPVALASLAGVERETAVQSLELEINEPVMEQPIPEVLEVAPSTRVEQSNPVVSEFAPSTPLEQSNPVVSEFAPSIPAEQSNPVISEFSNPVDDSLNLNSSVNSETTVSPIEQTNEPIQTLSSNNSVNLMGDSTQNTNNNSNLDIFG